MPIRRWVPPPFVEAELNTLSSRGASNRLWISPRKQVPLAVDFFVETSVINPRSSLVWWGCRTPLKVINSHDRFWTSLHRVLWSREITSGYCQYLMGPRVSINVEEPFIVLSFHVQWCGFLLKSTYPNTALWNSYENQHAVISLRVLGLHPSVFTANWTRPHLLQASIFKNNGSSPLRPLKVLSVMDGGNFSSAPSLLSSSPVSSFCNLKVAPVVQFAPFRNVSALF